MGAAADMMLTPFGAIMAGTIAGVLSTIGYQFVSPYLAARWKITDTCGVHNLHGMPSVMGGLLSVLLSGLATTAVYDQFNSDPDLSHSSLVEIFPRDGHYNATTRLWEGDEEFWGAGGWTPAKQAGRQFAAMAVTMVFAVVGGLATGLAMKWVAKFQSSYKKGATVAHLALNIGNVMTYHAHPNNMPKDMLFDDNAYFAQESDSEDEGHYAPPVAPLSQSNGNGAWDNKGYHEA